jgi:hypothetical protein
MITIQTEADVIDELRSFDANEWKLAPLLQADFNWQNKANKK